MRIFIILLLAFIFIPGGAESNARRKKYKAPKASMELALIDAVFENRYDDVNKLLKKGADPETRDLGSDTPLIVSIVGNNIKMAEILINGGANIDYRKNSDGKCSDPAIFWAISFSQKETVEFLLKKGANISVVSCEYETICGKIEKNSDYFDKNGIKSLLCRR